MPRWLLLSSYHWLVLFAAMGICGAGLAWISFGLFNLAMANLAYLTKYGLMAVADGGLLQAVEIGLKSLLALVLYLGFKAIEHELVYRWCAPKD
jgi:hypothetical protein